MGASAEKPEEAYREYLERFQQLVGPAELGSYAKHNGRLIKKLSQGEFDVKWAELAEVTEAYELIVANGDTINDVLVKVLRERCDELLMERKI